jgi:allophanate hydrolase subunit 1
MIQEERLYQSILVQLSAVPTDYLQQVDNFLQNLTKEIHQKEQNRNEILNLASAWSDMSDSDFEEYLQTVRNTKSEMFSRDIEL